MNIHEHQAKELLGRHGVPVQAGRVAFSPEQATEHASIMIEQGSTLLVIKSQIHAGGRGKGIVHDPATDKPIIHEGKELRGVKVVPTGEGNPLDTVYQIARKILGNTLVTVQTGPEGKIVHRLLIADGVDIDREFYCSILLDRSTGRNVIMVSTEGGVEIEKVAEEHPEKILKEWADPVTGLLPFQARNLAFGLGLTGKQVGKAAAFLTGLYQAFLGTDASLAEINPLIVSKDGEVLALDAKFNFDDNALFRHPELHELRDPHEEDPRELEAKAFDLSYIALDGNIGCMVNGAGLAMATMDIIKLYGGAPANFLDVGGGATKERVTAAFKIILSDPNVEGILVNIFGGIMRCDVIAEGVVAAAREVALHVPLVVRLEGTNVELGKKILTESGMKIIAADTIADGAQKIVAAIKGA